MPRARVQTFRAGVFKGSSSGLNYKGLEVPSAYRIDFLVENQLILEIKSVERFEAVHQAQLLTYLRLTGKRVGLLLNFNEALLKDGILRRVL